ncbi:MAG: hypothetical protein N2444_08045, partial [Methylocystis sp.]|nr:hypothetical protein [Methylocystis sp.]
MSGLFRRAPWLDVWRERYYRRRVGRPENVSETEPCISRHGDFDSTAEGALVTAAFDKALVGEGGPPEFVRAVEGMSGQKYRT